MERLQTRSAKLTELVAKRARLVASLSKGPDVIAEAQKRGEDDSHLQRHFERLLHEYRRVNKAIASLGAHQPKLL